MIQVIRVRNYDEISAKAFDIMHDLVVSKPDAVLGLATGSTPIGLYQLMV